jgi:hypothetical protein
MDETLVRIEKLRRALERVLGKSVKAIPKSEWISALRSGGRPTRLEKPFSPFGGIASQMKLVSMAASAQTFAAVPGFHFTRLDDSDAPNIFNTDSYDVIDNLSSHPAFPSVLKIVRMDPGCAGQVAGGYVFSVGPLKRKDHHSPRVPEDIAKARRKGDQKR